MSIQVKRRRDTAANIASFTPAQGELIVDTTNNRVIVGDGSTAGGFPAAKLSEVWTVSAGAFTAPAILVTGTTLLAPLKFVTGSNLTAATAGAWEYDGTVFYSTVAANERGVVPSEQVVVLSSSYTLTSTTAAQKLFNATSAGTLTLAAGTYQFECMFSLSSMSVTSGTFGFALGGTATISATWRSDAAMAATQATPATVQTTFNASSANTTLTSASTSGGGYAIIKGILRVTVAGTVIPQVSLGVAAASVVASGSMFKVSPLGSSSMTNVGNWT